MLVIPHVPQVGGQRGRTHLGHPAVVNAEQIAGESLLPEGQGHLESSRHSLGALTSSTIPIGS